MIINLVNNNSDVRTVSESLLCMTLLRFMEASKDIMHDDIRHKKLLEAFDNAVKTFERVGFDVIITDGVDEE